MLDALIAANAIFYGNARERPTTFFTFIDQRDLVAPWIVVNFHVPAGDPQRNV